tara:strand:+ start:2898 stop:6497 length:3600 start_codon:yes stop_codon:yes gene_type:complete
MVTYREILEEENKNIGEDQQTVFQTVNEEEENSFFDSVVDVGLSPVRGIAGAVESAAEIGNIFGLDYDIPENLGLGGSETMVGGAVEGITQFATGFIPGIGLVSKAGKFTKIGGATGKVAKAVAKATDQNRKKTALAITRGSEAIKYAAAGAVADFTVFDGHEARLSNLVNEQFPDLANPLTEYLAADEDDTEIEGRFKAAIEGLGLGLALDGIFLLAKGIKAGRKAGGVDADGNVINKDKATKKLEEVTDEAPTPKEEPDATPKDEPDAKPKEEPEVERTLEDELKDFRAIMKEKGVEKIKEIRNKALNWKNVSSNAQVSDAIRIATAANKVLQEATEKGTGLTNDVLTQNSKQIRSDIADSTGVVIGTDEEIESLLGASKKVPDNVKEAISVVGALRDVLEERGQLLLDTTTQVVKNPTEISRQQIGEFLLANIQVNQITEVVQEVSGLFGSALRSLKLKPGRFGREFEGVTSQSLRDNPKLLDEMIAKAGGEAAVREQMQRMALSQNWKQATKSVQKEATALGAITEYWMNSILSGPITNVVNFTSAALTTLMAPAEKALGYAFTGDMGKAASELARYKLMYTEVEHALAFAKLAIKENEAILDPLLRTVETSGSKSKITDYLVNKGLKEGTMGNLAAQWLGTIANLPSRALLGGDEFFKQVNYRSMMKHQLMEQVVKEGHTNPRIINNLVDQRFDKLVKKGNQTARKQIAQQARNIKEFEGRSASYRTKFVDPITGQEVKKAMTKSEYINSRLKQYSLMNEKALGTAQKVTFTEPLTKDRGAFIGMSSDLSTFVNRNPAARLVLPFMRTPANIIQHFFDRVPLLGTSQRKAMRDLGKELNHADAEIRADAIGRLATGSIFTVVGLTAVSSGTITGGGPTDKARRKAMEDAGWQPYSVKIGNAYVSYRRLDPAAMTIGMLADLGTIFLEGDEEIRKTAGDYISAVTVSMARNLTSKTYLTGVTKFTNALSDPEGFGSAYMRSLGGSFIPNFAAQINRSFDAETKDIKNFIDTVRARIPGFSQDAPPVRNMFGEPVLRKGFHPSVDFISPFDYSEVTDDPLKKELAQIGHSFSSPRSFKNGVELREYFSSKGQSAYDRWLQLHGEVKIGRKTLRQELSRLIKSRGYKRLPYESIEDIDKSPRVNEWRKILSEYRAKAFEQMLKEFPEVAQRNSILGQIKRERRRGRSYQQLLQLLED